MPEKISPLDIPKSDYLNIIEKIESTGCDPMAKRHHLTRLEKAKIVEQVAARTGFSLSNWSAA